jgi:hypothetical protein
MGAEIVSFAGPPGAPRGFPSGEPRGALKISGAAWQAPEMQIAALTGMRVVVCDSLDGGPLQI